MSMGSDLDCADDRIERILIAIDCAVMVGLHPFPSNDRQISPFVYTCSWTGILGGKKYTLGGTVGYSLGKEMRNMKVSPS